MFIVLNFTLLKFFVTHIIHCSFRLNELRLYQLPIMNWKNLTTLQDLEKAIEASHNQPVALFKHSTRCPVSFAAKKTVEHDWDLDIDAYYLDLIAHRDISNAIAEKLGVEHQSPQMILVKNGKAVYDASHAAIDVENMSEAISI